MGNCCIGFKEVNYKSNGTKFYEYPALLGKDIKYVFKVLGDKYPKYKIISIKENTFENDKFEPKSIDIYYGEKDCKVTRVEIFN